MTYYRSDDILAGMNVEKLYEISARLPRFVDNVTVPVLGMISSPEEQWRLRGIGNTRVGLAKLESDVWPDSASINFQLAHGIIDERPTENAPQRSFRIRRIHANEIVGLFRRAQEIRNTPGYLK